MKKEAMNPSLLSLIISIDKEEKDD